jgi:hypothetical protein
MVALFSWWSPCVSYLLEDGLVHELVVDLASEDEEVRGRGIALALALVADQLDVFVITCLNVQMFKCLNAERRNVFASVSQFETDRTRITNQTL